MCRRGGKGYMHRFFAQISADVRIMLRDFSLLVIQAFLWCQVDVRGNNEALKF